MITTADERKALYFLMIEGVFNMGLGASLAGSTVMVYRLIAKGLVVVHPTPRIGKAGIFVLTKEAKGIAEPTHASTEVSVKFGPAEYRLIEEAAGDFPISMWIRELTFTESQDRLSRRFTPWDTPVRVAKVFTDVGVERSVPHLTGDE
jgi:hypothetical protein